MAGIPGPGWSDEAIVWAFGQPSGEPKPHARASDEALAAIAAEHGWERLDDVGMKITFGYRAGAVLVRMTLEVVGLTANGFLEHPGRRRDSIVFEADGWSEERMARQLFSYFAPRIAEMRRSAGTERVFLEGTIDTVDVVSAAAFEIDAVLERYGIRIEDPVRILR